MYRIYKNVELGQNVTIEDFVIIGKPPAGAADGEFVTRIGDNSIIRSHTVIYAGVMVGDEFQTGHHVTIREHVTLGSRVSVGTSSVVEHHVQMADGVRLHSQVFVCEFSVIEEDAWLGPQVSLTNAKYPKFPGVKDHLRGVKLCRSSKLGASVTVLPGVVVGENALVGAGSVVTKDVPGDEIWVGNPASFLKPVSDVSY